ncbi:hypothetical protein B0H13DRAFT_1885764 [Mycena leptocephala]|nr:hypothetical protein B0H13DRAFT_1885764 [Mycena leptocephala]
MYNRARENVDDEEVGEQATKRMRREESAPSLKRAREEEAGDAVHPATRQRVERDQKADTDRDDREAGFLPNEQLSGGVVESAALESSASEGEKEAARWASYQRRRHRDHLARKAAVAEMMEERSKGL